MKKSINYSSASSNNINFLIILFSILMWPIVTFADNQLNQACNISWNALITNKNTYKDTLNDWRSLESTCSKQSNYFVRLALLEMNKSLFSKASTSLEKANIQSLDKDSLKLYYQVKGNVLIAQYNSDPKNSSLLNEAEDIFKIMINEFPDYYFGHSGMGLVLYSKHNYLTASSEWEQSLKLKETIDDYKNLLRAYMKLNEVNKFENIMEKAIQFDDSIYYAPDIIGYLIKAQLADENYGEAKGLICMYSKEIKEALNDLTFKNSYEEYIKLKGKSSLENCESFLR